MTDDVDIAPVGVLAELFHGGRTFGAYVRITETFSIYAGRIAPAEIEAFGDDPVEAADACFLTVDNGDRAVVVARCPTCNTGYEMVRAIAGLLPYPPPETNETE